MKDIILDKQKEMNFAKAKQTRRMYWRPKSIIQDGQASACAWWRHCSETVFPR